MTFFLGIAFAAAAVSFFGIGYLAGQTDERRKWHRFMHRKK